MRSPRFFPGAGPALLASLMSAAMVGCRDTSPSPTGPEGLSSTVAAATAALAFREVSAGGLHTCAVTLTDQAWCWGRNSSGQLGTGAASSDRRTPVAVVGGLRFRQVSAGRDFSCGVTTGDRAYCWGFNGQGQLGDGTEAPRSAPVAVQGNHRFRRVTAGYDHTCGVTTDNRAWCWGMLTDDRPVALGTGTTVGSAVPALVAGGHAFRQVAAGVFHTCGVTTADEVYCWGSNTRGQIGDGSTSTADRLRPSRVAGTRKYRQVDAGELGTCAVTLADKAFCWGDNRAGQVGDGTQTDRFSPRAVAGGLTIERVTAGRQFACGEAVGNRTWCWGSNASGQLGVGPETGFSTTPLLVGGGHFFSQVSAGSFHTCARTDTGAGYCWGNNGNGSVGNGSEVAFFYAPEPVAAPN